MKGPSPIGLLPGMALVILASALAPNPGLGQGQGPATSKPRPKDGELLKSPPFDRITLIDNTTFEIEPISPRPLPEPRKKSLSDLVAEDAPRPESKRKRSNDGFVKKDTEPEDEQIIIHMTEGEVRDYKVRRGSIKAVEYFEDMVLAEGDKFLLAGDFARAFERYLLVRSRDPGWKGVDDRVNRLLFDEAGAVMAEDGARGLRLLTDLLARKPDYPGLLDRLAASYSRRIDRAISAGEYSNGRGLLRELDRLAPGHSEVVAARGRFVAMAKGLVDEAARAPAPTRVDRLADAARVWPDHDGLERAYRDAFRAEPTLAVAVVDLAGSVGPFPRSPAADRVAPLLYLPLLASEDESAVRGEVAGQLLAGLDVGELGKSLTIRLKPGPTWSDGSRPVSAIDVARSLADRASTGSPGYNARWADLLDRVEATDDDRVVVRLARPSMKPEGWLLTPVGPAHASADGWVSTVDRGRSPVGDGPFRWVPTGDGAALFEVVGPKGAGVRRVREVRLPGPTAAFDALARGDVALLEHVPADRLAEVRALAGIKLGSFATPSVHRIALDGRAPALRNRKVRRALSLAIDRKTLLEESVLRRPPDDLNRVADGPFVRGSYVDAPDVEPLEYNPLLARGLVAAARKELGGSPIRLAFEYPATPEARAVCPRIAEGWRLIGVEVVATERLESDLESGLRAGRRFDLAYRSSRPSQPLRDAGPLLVPGYDAPPSADALASAASPRILQLLIGIDRAPETTSARGMAVEVDRESRDELPVLPLWQLEDHYAWRPELRGPGEASDRLYQGIATWEVEPCFQRDPR